MTQLIFYYASQGNAIDKLIAWYTSPFNEKFNGKWKNSFSHVEILFDNGQMFSASQYENEVRLKKHYYNTIKWKYIKLNLNEEEENSIKQYSHNFLHKKYDYLGIFNFVIKPIKQDSDKWFCSEICSKLLNYSGHFSIDNISKISPNDLYKIVNNGD